MNRELFNEKKRMSQMNSEDNDPNWAKDVTFTILEQKIVENHKASEYAFRPLDEKKHFSFNSSSVALKGKNTTAKDVVVKKKTGVKDKDVSVDNTDAIRKHRRIFYISLAAWSLLLIIVSAVFLYKFYYYLADYERVYNASLPYHTMESFMNIFDSDSMDSIYEALSEKPEISSFENEENVKNYMHKLLEGKEMSYAETSESTDKIPVYHVMADEYIVGKVTLYQDEAKLSHDLPIYHVDTFEMYFEPEWSTDVQAYDGCSVYVNDQKVSPEYEYRVDIPTEKHFDDFTTLPLTKYYKVLNLYEQPSVMVVNSYGQEITPVLNTSTGVYETPLTVPEEVEEEMIGFAKEAVNTYARVVCRELNDSALDGIFTKNNLIAKEIKQNRGMLSYFPNHRTTDVEDKIVEFIPYTEDAFYCEIEHTQHMLVRGVNPKDVVTDAKFYYFKENGAWKICAVVF